MCREVEISNSVIWASCDRRFAGSRILLVGDRFKLFARLRDPAISNQRRQICIISQLGYRTPKNPITLVI
jgi:hypothetical protein